MSISINAETVERVHDAPSSPGLPFRTRSTSNHNTTVSKHLVSFPKITQVNHTDGSITGVQYEPKQIWAPLLGPRPRFYFNPIDHSGPHPGVYLTRHIILGLHPGVYFNSKTTNNMQRHKYWADLGALDPKLW